MNARPDSSTRVLIVGWDGGTWSLLQPFADLGIMPNLAAMMAQGSYGELQSSLPPLTSAAWVSFLTGKNPGKHGCLLFTQLDSGQNSPPLITNSSHIDSQTLWEVLSAAGKRIISVNVPLTFPPRPINGIVITGMMTPSKELTFTYPSDLPEKYPFLQDYVIDLGTFTAQGGMGVDRQVSASPQDYLDDVLTMSEKRLTGSLELMSQESWQVFMVVFTGVDRLCHFFWKELAELAAGAPASEVRFGERLLRYFRWLDEALRRLANQSGDPSYILVMSDHGFGPAATRVLYLNSWLHQAGLLSLHASAGQVMSSGYWLMRLKRSLLGSKLLRSIATLLPAGAKSNLRRHSARQQRELVDWEHTKAYTVPMASYVAGIKVQDALSSEQREAVVGRLIDQLPIIVDPETNRPIFRQVARREEVYAGHHLAEFPDVIVVADERYNIVDGILGTGYVALQVFALRTGDHRDEGLVLLYGDDIVQGALASTWNLTDVTATILYLLETPLPADLDGCPIVEALAPDVIKQRPIEYQDAEFQTQQRRSVQMSPEEEEAILSNLRALGYIG